MRTSLKSKKGETENIPHMQNATKDSHRNWGEKGGKSLSHLNLVWIIQKYKKFSTKQLWITRVNYTDFI